MSNATYLESIAKPSLTVVNATSHEKMATLASKAIQERLYVPGFPMHDQFKDILDHKASSGVKSLSIIYVNGLPVGTCIVRNSGYIHTFVKKSFRRVGLGSTLVKSALKRNNLATFKQVPLNKGSERFYTALVS